jgi:predicted ATPase
MLRDAFETCRRSGWHVSHPAVKGALAEALAGLGQLNEALDTVDEAVSTAGQRDNGQQWHLPELLRIKGEMVLRQGKEQSMSVAEDCFARARELARAQGALFWELRSALSLARLRVAQGRHTDARCILAPVCDQFTEGFETADLLAARSLLDALPS